IPPPHLENRMTYQSRLIVAMLLAGMPLASRAFADAPTTQDVDARLEKLQARVDELEAKQATSAPTSQSTTQWLPPSMTTPVTVNWDGNRLLFSALNGNFTIHPAVTLDVRDMVSFRERIPSKGGGVDTPTAT